MSAPPGPPGPPGPQEQDGSTAFLLMALGRRARERVDAGLAGMGLAYRHLSVLGHLSGRPDLSYSELARRAGVTPQSMSATVARLEDDGAIERVTDPGRGRTSQLRLTDLGRERLRAGRAVVARVEEELLRAVPSDERSRLADTLVAVFRASAG